MIACSSVYQDFLFKEPVSPSNISIKVDALKWDQLELRLYQVVITSRTNAHFSHHAKMNAMTNKHYIDVRSDRKLLPQPQYTVNL